MGSYSTNNVHYTWPVDYSHDWFVGPQFNLNDYLTLHYEQCGKLSITYFYSDICSPDLPEPSELAIFHTMAVLTYLLELKEHVQECTRGLLALFGGVHLPIQVRWTIAGFLIYTI